MPQESASAAYETFTFERPADGVLLITMNRPDRMNAVDTQGHFELSEIWRSVAADTETRACVITGAGKAFFAGGDMDMIEGQIANFHLMAGDFERRGPGMTLLGSRRDRASECLDPDRTRLASLKSVGPKQYDRVNERCNR